MPPLKPGINNQLIASLPLKIRKAILAECETVELHFGDIIYEAKQRLDFAYFPLSGFFSLLTTMKGKDPLEMGLIGDEGMLGATLSIDIDKSTMQIIVQGRGKFLRLTVSKLRLLLREFPVLQQMLSRYLYVLMEQLMQSSACTYFHEIEQRLARWILMSHDRAHMDTLEFTHKFLASMLGVRRSGVTIAAGKLQDKELIDYQRGQMKIINRKGLEAITCPCYKQMKQVYTQNMSK